MQKRVFFFFLVPFLLTVRVQAQPRALLAEEGQFRISQLEARASLQSVLVSWHFSPEETAHLWGTLRVDRSITGAWWQRVRCEPFHMRPGTTRPFRVVDKLLPGIAYYRVVLERDTGELVLATTRFANPGTAPPLAANTDFDRRVVTVNYAAPPDKSLLLRLYNRIGEQLTTQALPAPAPGTYSYELDFAPYPPGVYLVVITQVEDNLDIADHRVEWLSPQLEAQQR